MNPVKKVLAISGSPRRTGNSSLMLRSFIKGATGNTEACKEIVAQDMNIKYCQGCLRCNLLGRCSLQGDDWESLSQGIMGADVLVFASPVYFHHLTAPLKIIIDRFRSFVKVEITETGLNHTPWTKWHKDFVLLLSMGSSDDTDAKPIIELFEFMTSILGPENRLHVITGTRLAVTRQIEKTEEELETLYPKLNLTADIAKYDYIRNQKLLNGCFKLGEELTRYSFQIL